MCINIVSETVNYHAYIKDIFELTVIYHFKDKCVNTNSIFR